MDDSGVQRASSSASVNTIKSSTYRGRRSPNEVTIETYAVAKSENDVVDERSAIPFNSGNPYVEKTEGIIHLFKQNATVDATNDTVVRSDTLVILAIPSWITSKELMDFIAPMNKSFNRVRIVRDGSPNCYMALIGFHDQASADEFYRVFNNAQYNSIEPDQCHLAYVDRVEVTKETHGGGAPLDGHTELPTCPVCLERMDESIESVLTILCNHTFHGACLSKWSDSSCPVCRFNQTPEAAPEHNCMECKGTSDLWICLICGHVGCGRYEQKHAYEHFLATSHTFSLQVGTQRVWDYAGDNYVHRLIAAKDGKPVELESPARARYRKHSDESADGGRFDVESDEKVEGITMEYTFLLTSQLDSQRRYFEEKLMHAETSAVERIERLETELDAQATRYGLLEANLNEASKEIEKAQKEKEKVEHKHQAMASKFNKVLRELQDEKTVNDLLRKEQSDWRAQVDQLARRIETSDKNHAEEIANLSEQLRDVMFHLEAEGKIKEAIGGDDNKDEKVTKEELEHSSIEVASVDKKRTKKKK